MAIEAYFDRNGAPMEFWSIAGSELLGESRSISITWSIEDIRSIREDLTDEQAMEVLKAAERGHDASIGLNWDVLQVHADMMFPRGQ